MMKVRNLSKLVRLEAERRQYIRMKNRLLYGRMTAAAARLPGGLRGAGAVRGEILP